VAAKHAHKLTSLTTPEQAMQKTAAGTFSTQSSFMAQFTIPELHETRLIRWQIHLMKGDKLGNYDMIVGQDLLNELGIDMLNSQHIVEWDGNTMPMKAHDGTLFDSHSIQDNHSIEEFETVNNILDAKHEPANLEEVAQNNDHLSLDEQNQLLTLSQK